MTMLAFSSLLLLCPSHHDPAHGGRTDGPVEAQPRAQAGSTVYNLSLVLMQRIVDDAEPSDEQPGVAVEFDSYRPGSWGGWEIGISTSSDEQDAPGFGDFKATVSEIYGGVRKTWGAANGLHPYLGGGLSFIEAEAELSGFGSEDDTTIGVYARGGAYWTLAEHFNLGADLKAVVGTDLDFGDADYVQFGVILGWSF